MKSIAALSLALTLAAVTGRADEIAVTIYNSDLGVISETRDLSFQRGSGEVAFRDVPDQIDPASVRFEVVGNRNVSILEQNYAYDLVSTDKIYARFIDNEIELLDKQGKLISGVLLSAGGGAITLRDSSGRIRIVLLSNVTEVDFPKLPEGLITRPTLFWRYSSDFEGSLPARVSYQTSGLNWAAEYVGVLNPNETRLNLSGWASITNNTSKTFADAAIKLVAGDIARMPQPRPSRAGQFEMAAKAADAGFEEKAFFEYHLYTLPRKSTLAGREVKQISLFEPASTGVAKRFLYKPEQNAGQVEVALKLKNSEADGLGMPLPEGRVRIFKADDDGSLVLLGEDAVRHTPRDEEVNIRVGYAFDIVPEERLMNQKSISQQIEERTYELEMRNRKDEPVTVTVEKQLYGDWKVTAADFEYKKKDARTLTFDLKVPAREIVKVTYTVRLQW